MNAHVFTTRTSAADASRVISWPASRAMPSITSPSTRFFGQPRDRKPIFMRESPSCTVLGSWLVPGAWYLVVLRGSYQAPSKYQAPGTNQEQRTKNPPGTKDQEPRT